MVKNLWAETANIRTLIADEIKAVHADIDTLEADVAKVEKLIADEIKAVKATINNLSIEDTFDFGGYSAQWTTCISSFSSFSYNVDSDRVSIGYSLKSVLGRSKPVGGGSFSG